MPLRDSQVPDEYLDPQALEDLIPDTPARLARPDLFLIAIIRRFWTEATDDEASSSWRKVAQQNPGFAIDVLNCLHQITMAPPGNLVALITGQGRYQRETSGPDGGLHPYRASDYVAWLHDVSFEWESILRTEHAGTDSA